uniref:Uncharacterized protein n=1 Tax=Candidatus Kentrum sp. FW TaxID=2126338 RepID=A0A450S426_9GAMM|nr:MAG: hypothetical protein BECKFW1821A_GA0114235_101312 [Candidatus Kentron sp. FW]
MSTEVTKNTEKIFYFSCLPWTDLFPWFRLRLCHAMVQQAKTPHLHGVISISQGEYPEGLGEEW